MRLSNRFIKGLSVPAHHSAISGCVECKKEEAKLFCGLIPIKDIRMVACGKENRTGVENGSERNNDSNKREAFMLQ